MKRYCTSCGSPTDYSIKKPLYCSNCGKSFDNLEKAESVASVYPSSKENIKTKLSKFRTRPNINNNVEDSYDIEEDENDINYVPNIKNLEVETFVEETPKENLGSLLNKRRETKSNTKNVQVKNKKKRKDK